MMNSANGGLGTLKVILLSVAAGAMAAGCGAGSSQVDSESETAPVAIITSEASGEIVGSPSNVVIENNEFEGLTIDLDSYPTETTPSTASSTSTDFDTPHSLMAAVSNTSVEPLEIGDEEALEIVETGIVTEVTEPLVLGANPETASTDNDQETNATLSLDAPVQLYPVDGNMIVLGEPVLFSWIVSAALQTSTIAFDISIHSKDDSSTVFRNNMLPGTLCNSSGNCEWSPSSELPIEQGKNYEWHVSVSSNEVSSPKAVTDFGVLQAEPIEEDIVTILTPSENHVAYSSSISVSWEGPPNAVYDLVIYSDPERENVVFGTDGLPMDTSGIGSATSHTFTNDPQYGDKRYGALYWWPDNTYSSAQVNRVVFDYTAGQAATGEAYTQAKAGLDDALSRESTWFTTNVINNRGRAVTEAYYHRFQTLHGLVMAYEVSGQQSYLQKAVDMAMYYVNEGVDRDGDGYWDWYWGHQADPFKLNHDHYEWRSASGVAVVAAALHDNPGASVTPSDALTKMVNMLDKHYFEKWTHGNQPTGKSSFATKGSTRAGRNGKAAIALHKITGDSKYMDYLAYRPKEMVAQMKASYKASTNSYANTWWTDGTGGPVPDPYIYEDVSHAQDIITFFDYARQHGYTIDGTVDATFHQRLVDTLKNVVWAGQHLTYHTDGGGENPHSPAFEEFVTRQVAGWFTLATYDYELYLKALNYANTDPSVTQVGGNFGYENRVLMWASLMRAAVAHD